MPTKIEWCDETLNPIIGCTPCSPGCDNCYARQLHEMRHKARRKVHVHTEDCEGTFAYNMPEQYAKPFSELQFFPDRLKQLLSWKKPRRVFIGSMTDMFHPDAPYEWFDQILAAIALAPRHTCLLLTKRPERMLEYFTQETPFRVNVAEASVSILARQQSNEGDGMDTTGILKNNKNNLCAWPLPNLHLGVTVCNQEEADAKIPLLLQTPAAVRYLSIEPLLGPIDLTNISAGNRWINALNGNSQYVSSLGPILDGVIVGGETGPNARPMHPDWIRSATNAPRQESPSSSSPGASGRRAMANLSRITRCRRTTSKTQAQRQARHGGAANAAPAASSTAKSTTPSPKPRPHRPFVSFVSFVVHPFCVS
jgi:protein gp37